MGGGSGGLRSRRAVDIQSLAPCPHSAGRSGLHVMWAGSSWDSPHTHTHTHTPPHHTTPHQPTPTTPHHTTPTHHPGVSSVSVHLPEPQTLNLTT